MVCRSVADHVGPHGCGALLVVEPLTELSNLAEQLSPISARLLLTNATDALVIQVS